MRENALYDPEIARLIHKEEERQRTSLNLIASENHTSPQVLAAVGSKLAHKYAEGLPGKRYYGGCEIIDQVEALAIARARKLFGAAWVNVQPHAGSQANAAVMMAILNPGDKILGFSLNHGGHLTHGSPVNFSGTLYRASSYGILDEETAHIDLEAMAACADRERPALIICGGSSYSLDWDYVQIRAIADSVGAFLLADIAHPAGLIARGLLHNPLPHCHFITTTTHKTLRGPRGGMILMGQDFENPMGIRNSKGKIRMMSSLLDSAVFPGTQGGPHENSIAGKAIAFHEASTEAYYTYVKQVQRNAQALAKHFIKRGYQLVGGRTENHLLLINLNNQGITGKEGEQALGRAGIVVNKNMVPFDKRSPFITSGIRIGTPTVTTRGLKERDMEQLVTWIDTILQNPSDSAVAHAVRRAVADRMGALPIYQL